LQERLGFREFALGAVDLCQVIEAGDHVRAIRAKVCFRHSQSHLSCWKGLGVFPLLMQRFSFAAQIFPALLRGSQGRQQFRSQEQDE
jgi:hypothetical protein